MTTRQDLYELGTRELVARDPVIAHLVELTGPVALPTPTDSNFTALVRAITYQQLAGSAARAIYGRLVALLEGDVEPERILRFSPDELRAVGLSAAKAASVLDLSAKVAEGTVTIDDSALADLSDEQIVAELTVVRGIGEWTADIFTMIHLGRIDVLPIGDLGVRKGYGSAWKIPTPTPKELLQLGERFRPYRSVLAWYCWRADELSGGTAPSPVTGGV
ncbi:DNA-3-methyladenine glycosylase family protein [Herbiconiux sp. UC225_62]|uniref:DNA-3-methyladenine glycosylase family protein n=1 Tax=Herbiconiux sp. UC225_62 TaxID=3350168 RepID=UPI0036D3949A